MAHVTSPERQATPAAEAGERIRHRERAPQDATDPACHYPDCMPDGALKCSEGRNCVN